MIFWTTLIRLRITNLKRMDNNDLEQRPKQMQILHRINILLCVSLLWVGYDSLSESRQINLFLNGTRSTVLWTNEIIAFAKLLILYSIYTFCAFFIGFQLYKKANWEWREALICFFSGFVFLIGVVLIKSSNINLVWFWQVLLGLLFGLNILLSATTFENFLTIFGFPSSPNDILDDPNSMTHHESKKKL